MKKLGCGCLIPILLLFLTFLFFFSSEESGNGNFQPESPQEQVALAMYEFVLKNGGTSEFACAWIGNAEEESGLNPSSIQGGIGFNEAWANDPKINGYAFGNFQHDGGRRVALLNYAKSLNKNWQEIEVQLDYTWNHEGTDSQLLQNYSKSTDLKETTINILKYWERAGTKDDILEQNKRITSAQNWYDRLVKGIGGGVIGGGKIEILEKKLGQKVYNGQCYGLVSFYVDNFRTNIHLGAGSPNGLSGNTSSDTINAWNIGNAYAWSQNGFIVIQNPKYSDLKAGDIINFYQGGSATSSYGHTGVVASVDGNNKFTTYEQNSERGQINAKYARTWGKEFPKVASLVRKK